jgi:hypothetical protein
VSLIADLAQWSLPAFSLLLFLAQVLAREIGWFFGRRSARTEAKNEGAGIVVGSILGLLAFVLALTLSAAAARNVERREGGVLEANAIGTAWLQARALGDERATAIADLLEEYIAARMGYVDAERGSEQIEILSARTDALQVEIWGHVTALVRERPDAATSSLMNAVNTTFDMTTAQRFAVSLTLPERMVFLVLAITLAGMFALGYQLGLLGKGNRAMAVVMSILWTAVLVQILDMGAARLGTYRTDLQPYVWTMEGFASYPAAGSSP